MPRMASDVGLAGEQNFPPPDVYLCQCTDAEFVESKSGTEGASLTFATAGFPRFDDIIYCTENTVKRLNLVAQRLCGMSADTELPDDDLEAAQFLMRYILDNAAGRWAEVQIEEREEKYTIKTGKDAGKEITRLKRQIAFAGFRTIEQPDADNMPEHPPAMPPQKTPEAPPKYDPYPNVVDPFADPELAGPLTGDQIPF